MADIYKINKNKVLIFHLEPRSLCLSISLKCKTRKNLFLLHGERKNHHTKLQVHMLSRFRNTAINESVVFRFYVYRFHSKKKVGKWMSFYCTVDYKWVTE